MVRRGVLYLRYSSHNQTEQSIEGQQTECTKYCLQNNIQIVDIYIDRNRTASKDIEKREEFQRMMHDARLHKFDCVVVYALNRFSRNRYDSAIYKTELKKCGVELISATQQINDSPDGILLEALFEGLDQYYSAELSQKIKRGINESRKKGQTTGGTTPLGYKVENKKFVINPETAPIVQEAFRRYANGESIPTLVEDFNRKGYRTSRGKKFNRSSFNRIFRNRKYIGEIYENKNVMPALITDEEWKKVQNRIVHNRTYTRRPATTEYILTGRLFCGECNSPMIGVSGTSRHGLTHHYYDCSKHKHRNGCDRKAVPKHVIEGVVFEACKTFLGDAQIDRIADLVVKSYDFEEKNSKLESLKTKIQSIENTLENLIKSLEKGIISDTIVNRINDLEQQKLALSSQYEIENSKLTKLEPEMVKLYLNHVRDEAEKNSKLLVEMLIRCVTVFADGRVIIEFNIDKIEDRSNFVYCGVSSTILSNIRVGSYICKSGSIFFMSRLS